MLQSVVKQRLCNQSTTTMRVRESLRGSNHHASGTRFNVQLTSLFEEDRKNAAAKDGTIRVQLDWMLFCTGRLLLSLPTTPVPFPVPVPVCFSRAPVHVSCWEEQTRRVQRLRRIVRWSHIMFLMFLGDYQIFNSHKCPVRWILERERSLCHQKLVLLQPVGFPIVAK